VVTPLKSETFELIKRLAGEKRVLISSHGYDELADDQIFVKEVLASINEGEVIEDYPNFGKGPCCLVLQKDRDGKPIHVVWGIPKGCTEPAVLITAYRPDSEKWSDDYRRRV
jgi:hypothetical protein